MVILTASGLRGIIGEDLSPDLLRGYARAFARFAGKGTFALGSDTRSTSPMLLSLVESTLVAEGCKVHVLGVTTTPSVYRYVASKRLNGGLMITSSHNPPEWNGLKFITSGGLGLAGDEFRRFVETAPAKVEGHSAGGRSFRVPRQDYFGDLVSAVGGSLSRRVKVALDAGGGSASSYMPSVLSSLGCSVVSVNSTEGVFSRKIDPTEDPLDLLRNVVGLEGCDVGFAFDCDGDRLVIVDDKGVKLSGDHTLLLGLLSLSELRSFREIVVSMDTSRIMEDLAAANKSRIVYAPVGEANVVREMLKRGAQVGGEGSSGGLIDLNFAACRDGMLASVLVTRLVAEGGRIDSVLARFPSYARRMSRIPMNRSKAASVVEALKKNFPEAENIDGVKLRFDDGSWVLVRPSGTEEVLRISAEARTAEKAETLIKKYSKLVEELS